ncbi:MAG: hypothetical protein QOE23_1397 [Pseudonocardiales bacterium]|jgi:Flp pilus assembly protein TadB|nr:hypothetical protein [Pseudonocardiales bacterium]
MSVAGWLALALFLLPAGVPDRAVRAPARHRVRPSGGGRAAGRAKGRPAVPKGRSADLAKERPVGLPAIAAVAAAVLAVLPLDGWPAALLAVPVAAAGWLVTSRLQNASAHRPAEPRAVAFVLDLLAGALAAGSPPDVAIDRVVAAVSGYGTATLRHAAEPLARVGRLLQLGSEPVAAWAELHAVPGYRTVAESAGRCAGSGARLAQALAAVATDLRAVHQAEALSKAARVGVWSLLPLGLCFLPAFVCLGVVPVILGVGGEVFAGVAG